MNRGEYIWQSPHLPDWRYDLSVLTDSLAAVSREQGLLSGRLADVGLALRDKASPVALTEDVVQTCAIEGEALNVASVRSSVARRWGVDIGVLAPADATSTALSTWCWTLQVVSGSIGRERVHFEAPPASRLPAEMARFLAWVNATGHYRAGAAWRATESSRRGAQHALRDSLSRDA